MSQTYNAMAEYLQSVTSRVTGLQGPGENLACMPWCNQDKSIQYIFTIGGKKAAELVAKEQILPVTNGRGDLKTVAAKIAITIENKFAEELLRKTGVLNDAQRQPDGSYKIIRALGRVLK